MSIAYAEYGSTTSPKLDNLIQVLGHKRALLGVDYCINSNSKNENTFLVFWTSYVPIGIEGFVEPSEWDIKKRPYVPFDMRALLSLQNGT